MPPPTTTTSYSILLAGKAEQEIDESWSHGLGMPSVIKGSQIRIEDDNQRLNTVEDEMDHKAGKQTAGARPNNGQDHAQQGDRRNRADVRPVLPNVQARKHRRYHNDRKHRTNGPPESVVEQAAINSFFDQGSCGGREDGRD